MGLLAWFRSRRDGETATLCSKSSDTSINANDNSQQNRFPGALLNNTGLNVMCNGCSYLCVTPLLTGQAVSNSKLGDIQHVL